MPYCTPAQSDPLPSSNLRRSHQQILRLDVAVHDVLEVQEAQPLHDLFISRRERVRVFLLGNRAQTRDAGVSSR